jgi:hypothetical protein
LVVAGFVVLHLDVGWASIPKGKKKKNLVTISSGAFLYTTNSLCCQAGTQLVFEPFLFSMAEICLARLATQLLTSVIKSPPLSLSGRKAALISEKQNSTGLYQGQYGV